MMYEHFFSLIVWSHVVRSTGNLIFPVMMWCDVIVTQADILPYHNLTLIIFDFHDMIDMI